MAQIPLRGSINPPSQQPPRILWSNAQCSHQQGTHLQHLLKLQDNPPVPSYSIPFPPLRSPPNSPKWGNFTPDLHHHHTCSGQTKIANTNGWIISSVYWPGNTVAPLFGRTNLASLCKTPIFSASTGFPTENPTGSSINHGISSFQVHRIHLHTFLLYSPDHWRSHTCSGFSRYGDTVPNSPHLENLRNAFSPRRHCPIGP